ncbi:class I SAM-dependent methyltransferase [Mesorhizobium sp. CAU 1732]|uniref:class I SAM-dependent methyltransferase n=1 Tax=Mesorhizobium sp. CAU 1732 TaxID=3140358 RepID=UPI00326072A1
MNKPLDENARLRAGNERWKNEAEPAFIHRLESNLMSVGNMNGQFYPEPRIAGGYVVYQASQDELSKPLAERVPPTALRHYYGFKDGKWHDDLYLSTGLNDTKQMRKILADDGFSLEGQRIMEFGCSSGRLLRHFEAEAHSSEAWGIDLHSPGIHWAQSHLSPPFHFMTNNTNPHLPFEDRHFGLIFAGSVWTHIGELDDAWLLEMRRIMNPGGRIYITISDENTLAEVKRINPGHESNKHVAELDEVTGMLSKDYVQFVTRSTPWLQRSVYNREAWLKKIGRWFDVKMAKANAYGWQTGVLLEKR